MPCSPAALDARIAQIFAEIGEPSMRSLRITAVLAFAAFSICLAAASQQEEITVTGKLARAMAIGGESTRWAIELDAPMDIEGKQLHSIEVASQDPKKLNQLGTNTSRLAAKFPIGKAWKGASGPFWKSHPFVRSTMRTRPHFI